MLFLQLFTFSLSLLVNDTVVQCCQGETVLKLIGGGWALFVSKMSPMVLEDTATTVTYFHYIKEQKFIDTRDGEEIDISHKSDLGFE